MTVGDARVLRGLYDLKYLFGDKWTLAILVALAEGPLRRVEILSTISSYSIGEEWSDKHAVLHDSILARTLKKMTEEGLVVRTRCPETFPVKVMYSLRPETLEFLAIAERALAWVDKHADLVAHAQTARRHNGGDIGTLTGIAELSGSDHGADEDE
ncbi:helix-turn-helix domain-containing protein [Kutzneria sp. 744]|uniref:winged helix-turn-helix transcriptional regulator n=1 Tax=Kutzneria sp. (strain 744) TaxID=345341 RepID=UPI0005BCAACD|nr:winged helix-turn-helix transcriptional regulator [Kutzneria sp. 744]